MGTIGTSAVADLNIRGTDTETDVNSIAVSGPASSAFIIVGLTALYQGGPMTDWKAQAHYSSNGGESWLPCYKPPSGMNAIFSAPVIVMAPDFADSETAYCGNGFISAGQPETFSGFYVSTTSGTTWNGRGLLDHDIDEIMDIVPSPDYDSDSTIFMMTRDASIDFMVPIVDFGLLWETKDGGSKWELILGMTLQIPLPGVAADQIEIPATYPYEPSIFVTGSKIPIPGYTASALIARSTDEGNLFATTLNAPYDGVTPLPVQTWKVIDQKTLIVSNANQVWKTTDMGAHWIKTDDTDISSSENIVNMQLWNDTTIIVGTDDGNVYICQNWETDFSFTQVDKGPGIAGDITYVAFDTNYDDTGIIYAGISGTEQGVWRIDANGGDEWENIWEDDDILGVICDGNGILWAIADRGAAWGAPLLQSVSLREVNPTAPIDDLGFEYVRDTLTSNLWTDLETAPSQTYVFAIGGTGNTELWSYIDTLIKPTLISPANGATAAGTIIQGQPMARVVLRWDDLAKAQSYDYQVAYDTGFGSIANSNTIPGTLAEVNLYLGEKFYWRVRVNGSVWSQWSDVWSFTTPLGPASAKPVCMSPTEGEVGVSQTPVLQWSSSVEATSWELMVAKGCDFSNAVVNLAGSSSLPAGTTAYQITQALDQDSNYCWKVRAVNDDTDTMSPWSDTGTFRTLVVVAEEEESTPIWVWVVIALSAVLLVGVVVLILRTRRPI
jgi:hypothetical protein